LTLLLLAQRNKHRAVGQKEKAMQEQEIQQIVASVAVYNIVAEDLMPDGWQEGDPAPWRKALGYGWAVMKKTAPYTYEGVKPGRDVRHEGKKTLEGIINELREQYGLILVTRNDYITGFPGYTEEEGREVDTTHLTPVASINSLWCGGMQRIVYTAPDEETLKAAIGLTEEEKRQKQRDLDDLRDAKEILSIPRERIFADAEAARRWRKQYNEVANEGGDGYIPRTTTLARVEWARGVLARNGIVIAEPQEEVQETSTTLVAYPGYPFKGRAVVRFTEAGWELVEDTRDTTGVGYLHCYFEGDYVAAKTVTEKVRNNIIRYFFKHELSLPGLGASPQEQYFQGLSREDRETIGNDGVKAYYA
jgi:hypothetical protein